jgi:hypothetical protein
VQVHSAILPIPARENTWRQEEPQAKRVTSGTATRQLFVYDIRAEHFV